MLHQHQQQQQQRTVMAMASFVCLCLWLMVQDVGASADKTAYRYVNMNGRYLGLYYLTIHIQFYCNYNKKTCLGLKLILFVALNKYG